MIYNRKQLPELLYMKHRNDDDKDYVDYESFILKKSLSPHIYQNDRMNTFLNKMEPLVALLFDNFNFMKNFKNYMVDKDHYKQKG
jgi:hypothetical protein